MKKTKNNLMNDKRGFLPFLLPLIAVVIILILLLIIIFNKDIQETFLNITNFLQIYGLWVALFVLLIVFKDLVMKLVLYIIAFLKKIVRI